MCGKHSPYEQVLGHYWPFEIFVKYNNPGNSFEKKGNGLQLNTIQYPRLHHFSSHFSNLSVGGRSGRGGGVLK